MYTPQHIANSYNGYGGNGMVNGVGAHNQQGHQDGSMNGPMNAHLSQNHPINGHGQQNPYDMYSNTNGIPSRGYPTDNLGMQSQQSMYSSPSLNGAVTDSSSFHHNPTQSFTIPQDYSFSSIPRNTNPSMSDLRRIAGMDVQNGYRSPGYQGSLGGMNGMDAPSLNAHAQPQQPFPDFSRYQQQNVYTSPPSRHGSGSSPFSPSQNDMMQDLQPHPTFHNQAIARYDDMSNFPGTNSINASSMDYSQPDARTSSMDVALESQGSSNPADPNDFQSFIRYANPLPIAETLNMDSFLLLGATWTNTHGRQTASLSANARSLSCPVRSLKSHTETKRGLCVSSVDSITSTLIYPD
jgi:hypothetical protein